MKNNLFKLLAFLFVFGFFIASCEDLSLNEPGLDTSATQDNVRTERIIGDVFGAVDNGINMGKAITVCPEAVFDFNTKVLTLNYGDPGCLGADGVTRSGIITASFTNFDGWLDGTSAVVSFNNFKIDGNQLTGVVTITAHVVEQVTSFTVEATEMSLTFTDQSIITWSSNSTLTLENVDANGKYWKINGDADGVSRKGVNFSRTSVDLLTDPTCKWFVGGTLTFNSENVVDLLTFSTCGNVSIKHNNLPAIQINLNSI
jgi:hypothetical protein